MVKTEDRLPSTTGIDLGNIPQSSTQKWEFYIAGVQHHESHRVLDLLGDGIILNLKQKQDNKYDPNAVEIHLRTIKDTTMLGFIPMRISASVNAFLEYAGDPICVITEFDKDKKPWERIKVVIKENESRNPDVQEEEETE